MGHQARQEGQIPCCWQVFCRLEYHNSCWNCPVFKSGGYRQYFQRRAWANKERCRRSNSLSRREFRCRIPYRSFLSHCSIKGPCISPQRKNRVSRLFWANASPVVLRSDLWKYDQKNSRYCPSNRSKNRARPVSSVHQVRLQGIGIGANPEFWAVHNRTDRLKTSPVTLHPLCMKVLIASCTISTIFSKQCPSPCNQ